LKRQALFFCDFREKRREEKKKEEKRRQRRDEKTREERGREEKRQCLYNALLLNALPVPMPRQVVFYVFFRCVFWAPFLKDFFEFFSFLELLGVPRGVIFGQLL